MAFTKQNGPFPASFSLLISFIQTVNNCSIKVANDDWVRTRILRYRNRPCCQQCYNHCPDKIFFGPWWWWSACSPYGLTISAQNIFSVIISFFTCLFLSDTFEIECLKSTVPCVCSLVEIYHSKREQLLKLLQVKMHWINARRNYVKRLTARML